MSKIYRGVKGSQIRLFLMFYKMDLKEKFFKVYASLPIEEREKVVIVIDNEPISWNLAYQQLKNDTRLGHKILKMLEELEII